MKLEYTSGCICDSLNIDNVETIDMPIDKFKEVLHTLLNRESDLAVLQQVYMSFMESQGNYESSNEPCDCCGDYVVTYTLEIDGEN